MRAGIHNNVDRRADSKASRLSELDVRLVESDSEQRDALRVRNDVFVQEQKIPVEVEADEYDETAIHAIACLRGKPIGTGRVVLMENGFAKIGRMAVARPFRSRGVGGRILQLLECEAQARGAEWCFLYAQEYVKDFYAARGYRLHGEPFLEVDIPHVEMRKRIAIR